MIVKLKLNNLLWMLTGRSSGFVSPLLNTGISFPPNTDKRVLAARQLLKLDVPGIDFFAHGAMAALYSSLYYLRDMDTDHQTMFVSGVMPALYRESTVPYYVDGQPMQSGGVIIPEPTACTYSILPDYDEDSLSTVRNHCDWHNLFNDVMFEIDGIAINAHKRWMGNIVDSLYDIPHSWLVSTVQLDALDFAGIRARITVDSEGVLIVNNPPTRYPYATVRALIAADASMLNFMAEFDTIGAFHSASDDIVSVGALAAAIVRCVKTATPAGSFFVDPPEINPPGVDPNYQLQVDFTPPDITA